MSNTYFIIVATFIGTICILIAELFKWRRFVAVELMNTEDIADSFLKEKELEQYEKNLSSSLSTSTLIASYSYLLCLSPSLLFMGWISSVVIQFFVMFSPICIIGGTVLLIFEIVKTKKADFEECSVVYGFLFPTIIFWGIVFLATKLEISDLIVEATLAIAHLTITYILNHHLAKDIIEEATSQEKSVETDE